MLRGYPVVQEHDKGPRTILAIKVCNVIHSQPLTKGIIPISAHGYVVVQSYHLRGQERVLDTTELAIQTPGCPLKLVYI